MDYKNKEVIVFGAGISGIGAAALLLRNKARVTLYDGNEKLDKNALTKKVAEHCKDVSALKIETGELSEEILKKASVMVLSPGIPTDLPVVKSFYDAGGEIIGEIELAYSLGKGRVYAVTGTNGKTTTTTLLGELMKAAHPHVDIVGNIGNPYTNCAASQHEDTVTVIEMSSFQLETIKTFHPLAAVITNITPDHLNRHHTMENYIDCKKRIVMNQTEGDVCILNYEDEILRKFGKDVKSKVIYFSSKRELEEGIFLKDDKIVYKDGECRIEIIDINELQLVGLHNYENVMCAAAVAVFDGMDINLLRQVLREFKGVEHRIEYVGEFDKVKYYNDSKGTNPAAAIKGIQAMKWPTLLIAGGYDKQSSYEEWINCFDGKVKYLVLIGQTKEKIKDAALHCGLKEEAVILCDDLKEAVDFCKNKAVEGDAVLLSPACASWGQFDNYEQRGDIFKEYVRNR